MNLLRIGLVGCGRISVRHAANSIIAQTIASLTAVVAIVR